MNTIVSLRAKLSVKSITKKTELAPSRGNKNNIKISPYLKSNGTFIGLGKTEHILFLYVRH